MIKIIKVFITTLILLFVILVIYSNFLKARFMEENRPLWSITDSEEYQFHSTKYEHLFLKRQKNKISLLNIQSKETHALFPYYQGKTYDIKMYLKDIDQNGEAELIFYVANESDSNDVYIFSNFDKLKPIQYKRIGFLFTGTSLLFNREERLYIRDCGSQYCNDTYYIWDGVKLVKEYTDTYESA